MKVRLALIELINLTPGTQELTVFGIFAVECLGVMAVLISADRLLRITAVSISER
jgi:hypothetical protein